MPTQVIERWRWRLAASEAGLTRGSMTARGIPVPITIQFLDHAARVVRADASELRHGFQSLQVHWETLGPLEAFFIRQLVVQVGNGDLYVTAPRLDALKPGLHWIDVRGRPSLSDVAPKARLDGRGAVAENVVLTLRNAFVVNDPAVF